MAKLGNAIVFITGEVKGLNKALGDAQSKTKRTIGNIQGMLTGMGRNMTVMGGAITGAFGLTLKMAAESEAAEKQLETVLKSTGGAAGMTAEQLKNLATELQGVTTFEDDAIIGGESLLLTFTKIGGDVFPQATETMLNMSQALGQDMKSSAVQLGKALNDPIRGVTALGRVGVSFTEQQREQIKAMVEAGDVAGAQKIILAELSTEFGGSARAAAETFGGQLAQLKNSLGDVGEQIGFAIMPALQQMMPKIKELIPVIAEWVKNNGGLILKFAELGALLTVGGPMLMGLSSLLVIITTLGVAVAPLSVTMVGLAALAETFYAISSGAGDASNMVSRFVDSLGPLGRWIDKYYDALVWVMNKFSGDDNAAWRDSNTANLERMANERGYYIDENGMPQQSVNPYPPARAAGGPIWSGQPYMTGERGRELILPKMSGEVLNNSTTERLLGALGKMGGGRAVNIVINGYNRSPRELVAQINREMRMAS